MNDSHLKLKPSVARGNIDKINGLAIICNIK